MKLMIRSLILGFAGVSLGACGGGGGGAPVASIPPVPLAPTPPPPAPQAPAPVTIFASPQVGQYASVGISTRDDLIHANDRIKTVSSADTDQAHVRYSAGGYYEIQLPGAQWDRLIHYKGLGNPDSGNNYFQPASVAQNLGYLVTSTSRSKGYSYSELGSWGNLNLSLEGGFGVLAFGVPTPATAIPTSGSASYSGLASGTADVLQYDQLFTSYYSTGVGGTVALNVNFSSGVLAGSMDLSIDGGMNPIALGTFGFKNTLLGVGSATYSGTFDTPLSGQNYFLGRFTGPTAQETIGAWALPFKDPGDGQVHQAIGAWIAKQ